jgi:hypothetical protein
VVREELSMGFRENVVTFEHIFQLWVNILALFYSLDGLLRGVVNKC